MEKTTRTRLIDERKHRLWSQQDVAVFIGTTQNNVSRWELGITTPSPYFRAKICELFGKSAEELGLLHAPCSYDGDPAPAHDLATDDQDADDPGMVTNVQDTMTQNVTLASEGECQGGAEETIAHAGEDSVPASQLRWFHQRRVLILSMGGATAAMCIGGGLWWSAKARQHPGIQVRVGHPAMIPLYSYPRSPAYTMNDVDWSPSGNFIACAVGDKTIQILNAQTGEISMVYRSHTDYTECAKWAPDENRVASASKDRTVQIWNPMTGTRLLTYRGHTASVMYLAWSHSGLYIASCGRDGTVQVWDAYVGERITTYRGHQGAVWSVRWSPDDRSIVSGGEDGIVHVWNATNAQPSPTFAYDGPRTNAINEVDWSPVSGRQIASAHTDGNVYLWDALAGSLMLTYQGHTAAVRTARWSPDGRWIASGGADKTVQVWNALTGLKLLTNSRHTSDIFEVAWSPEGARMASASNDYTLQVCRIQW